MNEPLEYAGKPVVPMTPDERAKLLAMMERTRSAGGHTYGEEDILRLEATIRAGEKQFLDLAKLTNSVIVPNIPRCPRLKCQLPLWKDNVCPDHGKVDHFEENLECPGCGEAGHLTDIKPVMGMVAPPEVHDRLAEEHAAGAQIICNGCGVSFHSFDAVRGFILSPETYTGPSSKVVSHPYCDYCERAEKIMRSAHNPLCDCNCHRGGEPPL